MTPELTDKLLALPCLRAQAEVDAREQFDAMQLCGMSMAPSWEELSGLGRAVFIGAQSELLARLDRWQSQAWALREIAKLLGWDVGSETPRIFRFQDDFNHVLWIVKIGEDPDYARIQEKPEPPRAAFCEPAHFPNAVDRHPTVGVGRFKEADRAGVIAAILLHLAAQ